MVNIPKSHPRYESLMTRERIVEGVKSGLVSPEGLIAHGRGEAFDYLLGERTPPAAEEAARAAAAHLLLARNPVLSVNGNTAVLVPEELAALQAAVPAKVEVNLFHRTEQRVINLSAHLEKHGCRNVLGRGAEPTIPGLEHERARSTVEGIFSADVVLVPLEDGDRCQALRNMGKTVIVVDLNPLSRTARSASVSLTDNVRRAVPLITKHVLDLKPKGPEAWREVVKAFDHQRNLRDVLRYMADRMDAGAGL
ncbi:MAG TPA: 4-phosphopantoate--beta-alanine ligase [Candidatus Thermoplasmatota archaeon]|nr:4-phosphopantoate--beta-alanine ligase [Candidatus Thermoplasmatota archaeon]